MAKRVVTIGGGSGSPVINEALLLTAKIDFINAISAVFDTGGATGRMRTDARGQQIAFSDPMRNLISLIDPHLRDITQYKALVAHLTSRFWGRVLGQEVFAHFHADGDGFDAIQEHLTNLTGINFKGHVIPSTALSTNIKFSTQSGRVFTGEDQLDSHHMSKDSVSDMWLEEQVQAYPDAVKALLEADLIIFSCGSIYGSVLCNTLPIGIKEALAKTKAKIYLVTNLVSTRSETHNFKPIDFVNLVRRYTKIQIDGLIIPEMNRKQFDEKYPDAARLYDLDHSYFLGWEDKDLIIVQKNGVKIITHNATSVIETKLNERIIRHDPVKLSEALKTLL